MKWFWSLIYNFIFMPLFMVFIHLAALFNPKLWRAIRGRYQVFSRLKSFKKTPGLRSILIHAASMGEFEHIKPVINRLKEIFPHSTIIVTFFSPSGYENVKQFNGVDLFLYLPFDFPFVMRRFFLIVRPDAYIIAKYDIWPNAVWQAYRMQIPVFVVNASLPEKSKRIRGLSLYFNQQVYNDLTEIWVSSLKDSDRFKKLSKNAEITVTGDTKFDQVLRRKANIDRNKIISNRIITDKRVFIAGSIWPEDWNVLIPVFDEVLDAYPDLIVILVPHEPTDNYIDEIEMKINHKGIRYSRVNDYKDERYIIVNRIGVLASLYSKADFAYVGGSFKQNVHNVMEPAVFGIPVFYGPVHKNSFEAVELNESGASIVVENEIDFRRELNRVLNSPESHEEISRLAQHYIANNAGATERIVEKLKSYLS